MLQESQKSYQTANIYHMAKFIINKLKRTTNPGQQLRLILSSITLSFQGSLWTLPIFIFQYCIQTLTVVQLCVKTLARKIIGWALEFYLLVFSLGLSQVQQLNPQSPACIYLSCTLLLPFYLSFQLWYISSLSHINFH